MLIRLFATVLLLLLTLNAGYSQDTDSTTGLIIAEGWELVRENCVQCHSTAMVIQNAGSKATWRSRLGWMVETQGMAQLPAEVEDAILDYLANHYGQKNITRRPGLAADLMPPNPYPVDN
jgi:mono/diheme cytochrome c family protein